MESANEYDEAMVAGMSENEQGSSALLNLDLFRHAYPAIMAMRTSAREAIASGRWYPRHDTRELDFFASGWPNSSVKEWRQGGSPDIGGILGRDGHKSTHFPYSDSPEYLTYKSFVLSDPVLSSRFVPEGLISSTLEMLFVNNFVLNVAARCEALQKADTEESVMEVYAEVERAYLEATLRVDVMVPLLLTAFDEIEKLDLGADVSLERIPDSLQLARAPRYAFSSVSGPLRCAATHAVFVRNVQIDNSILMVHLLGNYDVSIAVEKVDRVLRCLRTLSEINTGYADIYALPSEWAYSWQSDLPALVSIATVRRYPEVMEDGGWNESPNPYSADTVSKLPKLYAALDGVNKRLMIAVRRLDTSRLRQDPEDQVLDACIGLEALLGNEQTEITHRLAQRAAVLLRKEIPPTLTYRLIKDVYTCRSKIAHGSDSAKKMTIRYNEQDFLASMVAAFLLAKVIHEVVLGDGVSSPEDLDAMMLNRLASDESDPSSESTVKA